MGRGELHVGVWLRSRRMAEFCRGRTENACLRSAERTDPERFKSLQDAHAAPSAFTDNIVCCRPTDAGISSLGPSGRAAVVEGRAGLRCLQRQELRPIMYDPNVDSRCEDLLSFDMKYYLDAEDKIITTALN